VLIVSRFAQRSGGIVGGLEGLPVLVHRAISLSGRVVGFLPSTRRVEKARGAFLAGLFCPLDRM